MSKHESSKTWNTVCNNGKRIKTSLCLTKFQAEPHVWKKRRQDGGLEWIIIIQKNQLPTYNDILHAVYWIDSYYELMEKHSIFRIPTLCKIVNSKYASYIYNQPREEKQDYS